MMLRPRHAFGKTQNELIPFFIFVCRIFFQDAVNTELASIGAKEQLCRFLTVGARTYLRIGTCISQQMPDLYKRFLLQCRRCLSQVCYLNWAHSAHYSIGKAVRV